MGRRVRLRVWSQRDAALGQRNLFSVVRRIHPEAVADQALPRIRQMSCFGNAFLPSFCHEPDRLFGGGGLLSQWGRTMAGTFSPSFPAAPLDRFPSAPPASIHHEILLIEAEPFAAEHSAVLRQTSRVVSTANGDV